MLLQIDSFIPDVKDRYFICDNGDLFTDYGERKLRDGVKNGYVKNGLTLKNGKNKSFFRRRLVMMCFNPIDGEENLQVNHIDGNKLNNSLNNLEWCTNQENRIHAVKLGLAARMVGENNPASKLLESQVIDIIHDLLNHVPCSQIMKKYDISKGTICAIKTKRNWTYLTKDVDFI